MAADTSMVLVGTLDISAASRFLSLDTRLWTAGTFQYKVAYGATIGSWACSIKRGIGPGIPQAFPTPLAFSSSVVVQPATDAADLSGTDTVYFTTTTAGTSGTVEIWACLKADAG